MKMNRLPAPKKQTQNKPNQSLKACPERSRMGQFQYKKSWPKAKLPV